MRSGVVAATVLLAGGVAHASSIASLSADADGDGAADAIELTDDGVLHVGPTATVKLTDSIKRATLSVGPVQGKPAVVARVTTPRGDEAFVLTRSGPSWQIAWRGEVGGVGLDAEYAIEVAGTPAGVLRYQTRPGVRRCDGKPAYLFPEGFDGNAFRRRKPPVDIPADAAVLTAKADADKIAAPMMYSAKWASIEAGADDAGSLAKPTELDDGRADTAWHLAADPEGQFFTFEARGKNAPAKELRILTGDQASAQALEKSNRIKELAIVSAQGAWRVDLPDAAREPVGTAYVVDLPVAITGCVTVVVASTYGRERGTTAIAELEVYADGERASGGEAMLVKIVAEDRDGAQNAAAALARAGAASLPALEAELAKTDDSGARGRLVRVLVAIHDPAVAPLLARAASAGWVEGDDLIAVAGALGALHQVHELRDLAAKDLPVDVRLAAAAAIEVSTPDGAGALVELAGVGPRPLRHLVIERLAVAPAATLVAAAQASATASGAGDLWRAATRSARNDPGARAATLAAMTAALATAPDYERRYRLVDGISTLGDAAALHELVGAIAHMPEAVALRQVAAMAIGASPRTEAIDVIVALAGDADPGVRLAALAALMQAGDDAWHVPSEDGLDGVIAGALGRDGWPDVRIRAAQALSMRCQRSGPARALADASSKDADVKVRIESLLALVQCHAGGVAELLAKTWDDDKAPLELRTRAIGLAVVLGDRALAGKLVGRFGTWRGAALESKDAVELAMQAANAIGRLAPAGAGAALVDALDDTAFPEIVGAAAAGLGSLGAACPAEARSKLTALSRSEDQQIRMPAQHALAACGK